VAVLLSLFMGTGLVIALLSKFLEILRRHFDIILLDTPPLDAASGSSTLSHLCDGVIFVIKAGHLSGNVVRQSLSNIPNEKIVGAILNQVKIKDKSSYYWFDLNPHCKWCV
jgi:Mrp family chromosome partitioning ATPase